MLARYLICIAAFVSGVCVLQCQPVLPPVWAMLAAALMGGVLAAHPMGKRRMAILVLAVFVAGFGYAGLRAEWRLADRLSPELEGRQIEAEGYVAGLVRPTRHGVRFLFTPTRVITPGASLPQAIQASWYGKDPGVAAGERWRLILRPKRVHGQLNPGGFDLESWFLQQDIGATATVRQGQRLDGHATAAWLARLRSRLRDKVNGDLSGSPHAGVIVALTVGEQGGIAPEQWQRFARTGITHLISISGLHITMLAGLAVFVTSWLWRRIPGLVSRFGAPRAALLAGVATALMYSALAGMAVPTQRTLFMVATAAWCLWRTRPAAMSAVWACALGVVVLIDPFAVLSTGFWLSFLTVGALLWAGGNRLGEGVKWQGWVRAQWAATLGSMPVLLAVFGQLPLVSPFANAVAIPLVSLLVTPLALAGLLDPSGWLLHAAERVFAGTDWLLVWLAAPDWTQTGFNLAKPWTLFPAALGMLLLLAPRGVPGRPLSAVLLLPLFFIPAEPIPHGSYRATVLDVGQGLAVLVETRNSVHLFDTGQVPNGERTILPALRAAGRRHLDTLLLSHNDSDHIGGAEAILAQFPAGQILHNLPGDLPWLQPLPGRERCRAGMHWEHDGVSFSLVWPPEGFESARDNAGSCALLIDNGRHRMLIPADLGKSEEASLIAAGVPQAEILVAGHHGGVGSSSPEWIAAIQPGFAVFSAGYRNHFGHPRTDTLARFSAAGTVNLRPDHSGALIFDVGEEIRIRQWRELHRRYWHTPGEPG